jgi:hypothetical protein
MALIVNIICITEFIYLVKGFRSKKNKNLNITLK